MQPASLRGNEEQGATYVELFFDLVFVFAITQVTAVLAHDLSLKGLIEALVIFWLVWWAWTQFTWTLNEADTEHRHIRLITLLATAIAFLMALAVPGVTGQAGWMFPLAYLLVRATGLWLQIKLASDNSAQLASVTHWALTSSLGLVAVVVAIFLSGENRLWALGVAAILDVYAALRSGAGEWHLFTGHFAERHGLIVIIALGESLIAAGVSANDQDLRKSAVVSTLVAVALVCALWWSYFGWVQQNLERQMALKTPQTLGRFARDVFSFAHFPVIAGVIGLAVAIETVIAHPTDHLELPVAVALGLGVALFIGGTWLAMRRAGILSSWIRPAAALALIGSIPLLTQTSGWVALMATAVFAFAVAGFDRPIEGATHPPFEN